MDASAVQQHLAGWLLLSLASHILPRIWQTSGSNSKLERHRERIPEAVEFSLRRSLSKERPRRVEYLVEAKVAQCTRRNCGQRAG
jgi:hypothetical protein